MGQCLRLGEFSSGSGRCVRAGGGCYSAWIWSFFFFSDWRVLQRWVCFPLFFFHKLQFFSASLLKSLLVFTTWAFDVGQTSEFVEMIFISKKSQNLWYLTNFLEKISIVFFGLCLFLLLKMLRNELSSFWSECVVGSVLFLWRRWRLMCNLSSCSPSAYPNFKAAYANTHRSVSTPVVSGSCLVHWAQRVEDEGKPSDIFQINWTNVPICLIFLASILTIIWLILC